MSVSSATKKDEILTQSEPSTFWLQMVPETTFTGLREVALCILTKAAFSAINIIKTK